MTAPKRNLAWKVRYVLEHTLASTPEDVRNNPTEIARAIAWEFYSHLIPADGTDPHAAITYAVQVPCVDQVKRAMKEMRRVARAKKRADLPVAPPHWALTP